MNLLYYKEPLDLAKEHEILSDKSYGFNVVVQRKNEILPEIYHNVTEVHYLFPSLHNDKRIAFESDIHCTGLTSSIEHITSVIITDAAKIEDQF